MSKIRERLLYELTREPKERKVTLQALAGRLLIGFFIMIFLFTIVSRFADSATIAKISTASCKRAVLNFDIEGSGELQKDAKKYLAIYEGVRIKHISVKEGQLVKKGDTLFYYDIDDLKNKLKDYEDELKKAEINLQKEKLNNAIQKADPSKETAKLLLERAKLDVEAANEELKVAIKDVTETKKDEYEVAKNTYLDAQEAYDDKEEQRQKEIENANKEITKAKEALEELYKDKAEAEDVMNDYAEALKNNPASNNTSEKANTGSSDSLSFNFIDAVKLYQNTETDFNTLINSISNNTYGMDNATAANTAADTTADSTAVDTTVDNPVTVAENNIFKQYYGEKEYEAHVKEVEAAKQNLNRVKEDLLVSILTASEDGRTLSTSNKLSYMREFEDANAKITELLKQDTKLVTAIESYGRAIENDNTLEIADTYQTLFTLLYIEDDVDKKLMKEANQKLEGAKVALQETTETWNKTMSKEEEAVLETKQDYDKAKNTYDLILANSYDFTEDVNAQEKAVKAAQRALEDAQSQSVINLEKNSVNNEIESLDLELDEMDLGKKQIEIDIIKKIVSNKGKVKASVSGIISKLGITIGSTTTGTEQVTIDTGNYGFIAKITKEEADRLEVGDEMDLTVGDSNEHITVPIENIGLEDEDGTIEITGIMPKGEYSLGTIVSFHINKQSEEYSKTIPIQALRMGADGNYYVLITIEKDSILGTELTSFKVGVNLIDKDYTTAAISGSLDNSVNIIVSSNKYIEDGDRVRIEDNND